VLEEMPHRDYVESPVLVTDPVHRARFDIQPQLRADIGGRSIGDVHSLHLEALQAAGIQEVAHAAADIQETPVLLVAADKPDAVLLLGESPAHFGGLAPQPPVVMAVEVVPLVITAQFIRRRPRIQECKAAGRALEDRPLALPEKQGPLR